MLHTFKLLKNAIGIVIFADIEILPDANVLQSDSLITDGVYLRILDDVKYDLQKIKYWMGLAIKGVSESIHRSRNGEVIVFELKQLDFDDAHFQEEALYCTMQGWILTILRLM